MRTLLQYHKVDKIHLKKKKKNVGLSSQIEAPVAVQKDLMNAATIGESSFKDFIQNRIESNNFGFYEPIKKNKLRSFDAVIITKIMKFYGKDIAIKNNRDTFARLLVKQRNHEIDIKEVLPHELSSVPWLFTIQTLHQPCVRQQIMNCSNFWRFNLEPYQWFQWIHPKFMMGWLSFRNYQLLCPCLTIYLISW